MSPAFSSFSSTVMAICSFLSVSVKFPPVKLPLSLSISVLSLPSIKNILDTLFVWFSEA